MGERGRGWCLTLSECRCPGRRLLSLPPGTWHSYRLAPGCGRNSRYSANDKLRELRLILPRFVVNGQCDLLRHAVGRTRLGGAELAGWLRIEHVVAVADIDLGLLPRDLEMVVWFCRSITVTSTGARRSDFAASMPPKPAPTMTTFARPSGMRLSSPDAYRATTSSMLAQDKAIIERLNQQFTAVCSKVDFGAAAAETRYLNACLAM